MCQIAQFLFELVCVCAMNHIIVMSSPPVNRLSTHISTAMNVVE